MYWCCLSLEFRRTRKTLILLAESILFLSQQYDFEIHSLNSIYFMKLSRITQNGYKYVNYDDSLNLHSLEK